MFKGNGEEGIEGEHHVVLFGGDVRE